MVPMGQRIAPSNPITRLNHQSPLRDSVICTCDSGLQNFEKNVLSNGVD